MNINIIGNFFGNSGYARHTRSLANALHNLGHDVRIDSNKPLQWEKDVNDFELNALSKPFDPECTSIFIGQPPYWSIALSEKPKQFIGYLVWEGDTIPESWIANLVDERIDYILVPSLHTYNAILKAIDPVLDSSNINTYTVIKDKIQAIKDRIKIIPEGYDPILFYPDENKTENDKLVFISHKGWAKGWNDRGGVSYLIKAFAEEFKKDESVELRIKLNTSYNLPNWDLNTEMKNLKLPDKEKRPLIYTTIDNMDDASLRKFYTDGDVFVSTSLAEGFNLPVLEAMACGVPVCTTKFGGQTDFVNDDNGWLIEDGNLEYISDEIQYEEVKWMKPDIKNIRKALRNIYNNRSKIKDKKINVSELTWLESAKKISSLISK